MNTVAVLVIEYQPNFVPFVPFHLVNEDCQLILLFAPKSKAYKHLYSDVSMFIEIFHISLPNNETL